MPHSLSLATIAAARRDYAEGKKPVDAICAEHRMHRNQLYFYVDGGDADGPRHFPPIPRRSDGVTRAPRQRRSPGGRVALVQRLWRTAETQVRDIEARLARADLVPTERERDARVLAVLVKTLRELTALDDLNARTKPAAADDGADAAPRDMDEFRRELARRIAAFVDARLDRGVPGDADGC